MSRKASGAARVEEPPPPSRAEFEARLAGLSAELDEARAQQEATAEVLAVINASRGDLAPVFDAIVERATILSGAESGGVFRYDGALIHYAASYGWTPEELEAVDRYFPRAPGRGSMTARAILTREVAHVSDLSADPEYELTAIAQTGIGATLSVPILREGDAVGAITVTRHSTELFTPGQIDLLETFADQAVIAIENVRLFNETQEALEQQAAAAEVLGVINASPGNLKAVFDAMLEKATRLCDAHFGAFFSYDGEVFHFMAERGSSAEAIEALRQPLPPLGTLENLIRGEDIVHIADLADSEAYRTGIRGRRILVDVFGARSAVWVALRRDEALFGFFCIYRREMRPFTDKQIALLKNFGAQAVIAMENARLINETREALEQQTATAEVLEVINASPGELAPVFDAMLEKAVRLCDAETAHLLRFDGTNFSRAASFGVPPGFDEILPLGRPMPDVINKDAVPFRMLRARRTIPVLDLREDDSVRLGAPAETRAVAEGIRSLLFVPLLREGEVVVGCFVMHRMVVRAFSDKEIALVENFAAQAVIAIENVRLITETHDALAQQTATAEVLGVINSSPGNLAPVWAAMLEKAASLCEANLGLLCSYDGEAQILLASRGMSPELMEMARRVPIEPESSVGRLARGKDEYIYAPDITDDEAYRSGVPSRRLFADLTGARTALWVALRKEEALIGVFILYRTEIRPFTDKQIALLRNFAQQAVIAMENARLLTETREALEKQTATAEILSVISSSPTDVQPTFEAIAVRAAILCQAVNASVFRYDGSLIHPGGFHGYTEAESDLAARIFPMPPGRSSATARAIESCEVVHIHDVRADSEYTPALYAFRTVLSVPMLRDGVPLGAITMTRPHVEPFSDGQIELLKTFADQAVIAIENVRLFNELNERTDDLQEALEYQTATGDVLNFISRSAFDLDAILQTVVTSAYRLCRADQAVIFRNEGGDYHWAAGHGISEAYEEHERDSVIRPGEATVIGRAVLHGRPAQIEDVWNDPLYEDQAAARAAGAHTMLGVPLLREGTPIGAIGLARNRVEAFSEREIQLVTTFADQAVIAIENVRLITETQEALEQQTATSEMLKVISGSTFDIQPVFETIVATAVRLCRANYGVIFRNEGDEYRFAAGYGNSPEYQERERNSALRPGRGSIVGRAVLEGRAVQIADAQTDPEYEAKEDARIEAAHTMLGVPLLREGVVIGAIGLARDRIEMFSERETALVTTFADQAVIAMENARLLEETRLRTDDLQESLEYQTATSDVLKVISRSTFDLQPVLDTVCETAARLCGAHGAGITMREGEGYRYVSTVSVEPEFYAYLRERVLPADRGSIAGRTALEGRVVHIPDIAADPDYALPATSLGKLRTLLGAPLLRDGEVIGTLTVTRTHVEPFTERQIDLVRTFADQAVIAIENTRLLNEIRQRQAELRVTFDNMGDGVAMFDAEHRLAAWNRNFQQILDLPDEFVAPRPTLEEYIRHLAKHGEYGSVDTEAEVRRLLGLVATHWSAERTRPDGRVVELRNDPVPGGGFVLIYSDVTERKRSEAEIRVARDAAEGALRELKLAQANLIQAEKMASLGQLTAGIAHEIKNPLNFVNNFALLSNELLGELKEVAAPAFDVLGEDARAEVDETMAMLSGNLDKIAEHGRRADGIVKSMLAHSRGSSGERQKVDLNALAEEALNLAYHGARAQDQNFNITLERDFTAGIAPIELAPQDMTRVLLNLIGNGFHAAHKRFKDMGDPAFKPLLRVATRELGDAVEVRVRDNGTGIPADIRDKLFQPFFTTKPTGEGTGLGLSISYDIVTQQHGGTITVESEVGAFTEFAVRLPRQDGERVSGERAAGRRA